MSDFFKEDDLMNCYPLWIMILVYICSNILLAFYKPTYLKLIWGTPSMILLNIINILVASLIFYSLCRNDLLDSKKRITAMVILFYPVIITILYLFIGVTNNTLQTAIGNIGGKKKNQQ